MIKRSVDILASTLGILILSPLLVTIALAVRISSHGSPIFVARRIGRHGHEFKLYKFRSMTVNADKHGPGITTAGDKRVTQLGRFLRRTKLDELPQLFNVLKGDMSLVGPRPEDPRYVALYTPEQRKALEVRPGITSMASVKYRNEETILAGTDWETTYIQRIMPEKLAIDLEYIETSSLWCDIVVVVRTLIMLLR